MQQPVNRSRSGMALVLVIGALVLITAALVLATERGTALAQRTVRYQDGSQALAAAEAVVARHERDVALLATIGDAANFSDWSTFFGHDNYGVDFVGDCEVRWKVEPARTAPVRDPAGATAIPYITNPSPDPSYVPGDANEQLNQTIYMYKVSAEARLLSGGEVRSRAQGARFVTVSRQPLFRYVIFYAQRGAKGDLEMGHADGVNIQGNVHTNGSLYLGGGLKVNDKLAQRGTFDGALNLSQTLIGPDASGKPVQATGVDGVFRLSKPLMFSIINGFPLTSTTLAAAGSPVGDWTAGGSYDTTASLFPLETVIPSGGVAGMTTNGTLINPYRIASASGAVTQGPGADTARQINNVPLLGTPAATANDGRDAARPTTRKWVATAASDYANRVRSFQNGGSQVTLSQTMANRPFEAQALAYVEADGDPTTDDHAYARPVFIDPATGATTYDLPTTGPAIESAGNYLALALGGQPGVHFVRRDGGTGWDVRARSDLVNPASEPTTAGLIIRERPIPDTDYWPGTTGANIVDPANPRWLPYAYGKQWYPTIDPFTVADVSDNLFRDRAWDTVSPAVTTNISTATANRAATYATGGRLTMVAAANPGQSDATTGTWSSYAGTAVNGIMRKQYFYRDAWRFAHLRKATADTTRNGLQLAYSQDATYYDENKSQTNALPFSGMPLAITSPADGVVASSTGRLGWATAPATPSATFWSARWSGFISPTATNSYVFSATPSSSNHRVRVWVSGVRVAEGNMPSGATLPSAVSLTAGRYYPIVVEFCSLVAGAPGTAPVLYWQPSGGSSTTIPDNRLFPPSGMPTFPAANFSAVQCRIDAPQAISGPASQKVGLMIRPEQTASPLLQGGSAYAMAGWSPTRGFFTQRRHDPATQDQRTIGLYYIGAGSSPSGTANAGGEVIDNPTLSGAGWNRTASLLEVWRSPSSTLNTGYATIASTAGPTWTTSPVAYSGAMSKDIGGGKIWTILDAFKTGPYIGNQTWTPQKYQQLYNSMIQTVQLKNSVGPFVAADDNKNLYIFTSPTASTQLVTSAKLGNSRTWYWSTSAGATSALSAYLSRVWTSSITNGGVVSGAPVTTSGYTVGSATTAWPVSGSTIRINKNGTVSTATASDIATVTGLSISGILSSYSIPTPTLTYPTDASCPAAAAPAAPALPDMTNGGAGRTFAVARTNTTITFDLDSWVSTAATLPSMGQAQFLPAVATWPATWTGSPTAWPVSIGLRPDVWRTSSSTAPTYGAAAVTALASATATAPGVVSGGNGYALYDDVKQSGWNTASEVWLRIEKQGANLVAKGFVGSAAPSGASDPGWVTIGQPLDIGTWGTALLAGPCVQSGSSTAATSVTFTDLRVETTLPAPLDVIDASDWDTTGSGTDDLTNYLISQYQVFFGTREITEDFFTWRDPSSHNRLANEDWFYNPREFWSQTRWWDHTNAAGTRIEKDAFTAPSTTFTSTRYRELLAKTTVLSLDLQAIQNYLRTQTMGNAVRDAIAGIGGTPAAVGHPADTLATHFNGLIYAARTNRYPWNPNTNALLGAAVNGLNPWSPMLSGLQAAYPNSTANATSVPAARANGAKDDVPARNLDAWTPSELFCAGVHKLQPYALPEAPAIMPERFHHGVRLVHATNIDWNYPSGGTSGGTNSAGGTDWSHATTPDFGTCRLSVVTPNQLYVQGGLNVDRHLVNVNHVPTFKPSPLAVMGDQVTFLSNAWSDLAYQQTGLTVSNVSGSSSVAGAGILSGTTFGAPASSTSYQAGIVTNNLPTTRERVREGQAAPFVDTMLFLENWNGCAMNYLGSLVVLDSRRCTKAFLHDSFKTYGTTPFGIVGSGAGDPWLPFFGVAAPDWIGQSPAVYSEPTRGYAFNYDFLTSEGTPPFVPFGVSSGGAGGWARIVQ